MPENGNVSKFPPPPTAGARLLGGQVQPQQEFVVIAPTGVGEAPKARLVVAVGIVAQDVVAQLVGAIMGELERRGAIAPAPQLDCPPVPDGTEEAPADVPGV